MAFPPRSVLLVEPWFDGSHRAWAEGIHRHSRHQVELLTRPPGSWRSTLELSARELAPAVAATPDVLVVSSMMDVAEFRTKAGLKGIPTLLYLHENQLTYDRSQPDLARGTINWRSVVAADRVAFNSQFHLHDFLDAVAMLGVSKAATAEAREKSVVIPVGIDPALGVSPDARDGGPPVVLWNHRWEADKHPGAFVDAVLANADLPFRLILAGAGRRAEKWAASVVHSFGDRVLHAGFAPAELYATLLRRADIVVSTAHQEFFGVSVAEAMACGAVPLVPDGLAYPELLGPGLAECLYRPGTLAERLRTMLTDPSLRETYRPLAQATGQRFEWPRVAPRYDELIDAMA